jgi:hypothetical protein
MYQIPLTSEMYKSMLKREEPKLNDLFEMLYWRLGDNRDIYFSVVSELLNLSDIEIPITDEETSEQLYKRVRKIFKILENLEPINLSEHL